MALLSIATRQHNDYARANPSSIEHLRLTAPSVSQFPLERYSDFLKENPRSTTLLEQYGVQILSTLQLPIPERKQTLRLLTAGSSDQSTSFVN